MPDRSQTAIISFTGQTVTFADKTCNQIETDLCKYIYMLVMNLFPFDVSSTMTFDVNIFIVTSVIIVVCHHWHRVVIMIAYAGFLVAAPFFLKQSV